MHTTRRDFLKTTLGSSAVISLGAAVPAFLLDAANAQSAAGKDTVLVVVQLTGGNDGLNTVIPYSDPVYRRDRPTLAIAEADVLKIDDQVGFHPSARGFADLLELGKLGVIQGVGYPNPNRSHFESMDIWHTCQRKADRQATGWLGRFADATLQPDGSDPTTIHLGGQKQPLAIVAERVRAPSIGSLDRFRLEDGGDENLRAVIGKLSAGARTKDNDLLGFIQSSATAAIRASHRVEEARQDYQPAIEYPQNPLADKLRTVAQLIDAGLGARVYYMEIDGFDTHSQQAAAHAGLLSQLSGGVHSFVEDMTHHGHANRVLVMAFSEFGRRVKENASEGTDHGAAAPMFLAGDRVKAGLIGKHPSLTDLVDGDVQYHTDFRQVYASLVESWLGASTREILGGDFTPVDVLEA